jgi:phage terminase large subunit-like protein
LPASSKRSSPARLWAAEGWTEARTDGLVACEFIEQAIRHTKGAQRGELVRLRHWQGDLICDILRKKRGKRCYRTYELWIPRKNSKSLLGAGMALFGLFDEKGAEVYSAAADKDQAKIVFKEVRASVEMSPELSAILNVYRDVIEYPATGSVYRALSSEAFTKEGLNPSLVIFDELHAQPNAELWNVMNQGSGTRAQPLVLAISTFGARTDNLGNDSIGYQQYQYCKKVLSGEVKDPMFGCRIYETPADADHRDEKVWHAANPALGDFLYLDDMRAVLNKLSEVDFKIKRLNIWVTGKNPALPHGAWEKRVLDRHVADDEPIVLGFDGSYLSDSTALVGCTVDTKPHLFVIDAWEKQGDPDFRVPIPDVEAAILETFRTRNVVEMAADPYRWQDTLARLRLELGEVRVADWPTSSPARMVPAWQDFYDAVRDDGLSHDGDPRLARHMENMVLKVDRLGARPTKESKDSGRKIDLGIAAIIAHDRATTQRPRKRSPLAAMV